MSKYRSFTDKEIKWINRFEKLMDLAPETLFLFVGAGQTIFAKDYNNEVYRTASGGVDGNANNVSISTPMECDGGDY